MKKLLGVSFIFQLTVVAVFLIGCSKNTAITTTEATPGPSSGSGYTYLALGDSYTIGQNVQEKERFPYIVADLLRQQSIPVKDPKYIAKTGWSTIALQEEIKNAEPLGTFDIVTLLIGVNDQYQGLDTAGYRLRFTQLLTKAVQLAGNKKHRVFVLSIPDYGATPFGASNKERIGKEIDAFNKINKEVTTMSAISYIDITPLTRLAETDRSLLANDGLHYSAKEHRLWASELVPLVKDALK